MGDERYSSPSRMIIGASSESLTMLSNPSHPFYTGKMKLVDTAGRVDKFMNRYKNHGSKKK